MLTLAESPDRHPGTGAGGLCSVFLAGEGHYCARANTPQNFGEVNRCELVALWLDRRCSSCCRAIHRAPHTVLTLSGSACRTPFSTLQQAPTV